VSLPSGSATIEFACLLLPGWISSVAILAQHELSVVFGGVRIDEYLGMSEM